MDTVSPNATPLYKEVVDVATGYLITCGIEASELAIYPELINDKLEHIELLNTLTLTSLDAISLNWVDVSEDEESGEIQALKDRQVKSDLNILHWLAGCVDDLDMDTRFVIKVMGLSGDNRYPLTKIVLLDSIEREIKNLLRFSDRSLSQLGLEMPKLINSLERTCRILTPYLQELSRKTVEFVWLKLPDTRPMDAP